MAEIEIGLLERGCLDRRIESTCRMREEIKADLEQKNAKPLPIKWRFTHKNARIKLHSIYPAILDLHSTKSLRGQITLGVSLL